MTEVVTLAQFKEDLNITGTAHDTKLQNILDRAHAILWNFLGVDDLAAWYYETGEGSALVIQQAVLVMGRTMYERPEETPLDTTVKSLVRRFRLPVIG